MRHEPSSALASASTLDRVDGVEITTNEDDTVTTIVVTGGRPALADQLGERVVAHYDEAGQVARVDLHMPREEAMQGVGKIMEMWASEA